MLGNLHFLVFGIGDKGRICVHFSSMVLKIKKLVVTLGRGFKIIIELVLTLKGNF